MNMRKYLLNQIDWLKDMLARSHPTKANAVAYTQQITDIEWRLQTEPPRPAPQCGWKNSYESHGESCPKHHSICEETFAKWRNNPFVRPAGK